jgi:hypothetical protein
MKKQANPKGKEKNKERPPAPKKTHWRGSDLIAAAKLATEATINVTHLVEEVHQSVLGTMGIKGKPKKDPKQAAASLGLTGLIYESVRTIASWVGVAIDTGYTVARPLLSKGISAPTQNPGTQEREAVLAALNGVLGDKLAATNNPLATPMSLRYLDQMIDTSIPASAIDLGPKVLLMIHGLCMNDLQWKNEVHEGIIQALGYTPLYLRYNTGLPISENGRTLAKQLAGLTKHFPAITELSVLSHSMGGLVIRSAMHEASPSPLKDRKNLDAQVEWLGLLNRVVFLGTPHHGAPLERAGHWIDLILGSTRFSAPFKRLTQMRSAGINDLRFGHFTANLPPPPLPEGVNFFCVAATLAAKRSLLADRLIGDGLVPLRSALGKHNDPAKSLLFRREQQHIFYKMNHMDLLSRAEVAAQLIAWFKLEPKSRPLAPFRSSSH